MCPLIEIEIANGYFTKLFVKVGLAAAAIRFGPRLLSIASKIIDKELDKIERKLAQ